MRRLLIKYIGLVLLDLLVILVNSLAVAWVLSLFTRARPDLNQAGEPWGGWFGTWDNPPQGDSKWQREGWLLRNPGYGFQRWAGIKYHPRLTTLFTGNPDISDKYKIPGSYFAKVRYPTGKLVAFEYYLVKPWGKNRCIRIRLGWKVMTDKFEKYGFAALVDTVNPVKTYGN